MTTAHRFPLYEPGPWWTTRRVGEDEEPDLGDGRSICRTREEALASVCERGERVEQMPGPGLWRARCVHCGEHAENEDYVYEHPDAARDVLDEANLDAAARGEPLPWRSDAAASGIWCRACFLELAAAEQDDEEGSP